MDTAPKRQFGGCRWNGPASLEPTTRYSKSESREAGQKSSSRKRPLRARFIHDLELRRLARWMQIVFSSANALGHLANFFPARGDSAVARKSAHEEITGQANRQHHGAACALRFDHCLSMAQCFRGGPARPGARLHRASLGVF